MKSKTKSKVRIVTVSVSRLFNLGNYENFKVELAAEVEPGGSARDAYLDLVNITRLLRPLRKPYEYDHAVETLAKAPEKLSENEKARLEDLRKMVDQWQGAITLRRQAIAALDALGGNSTFKDHKTDWDNEDETF